MSILDSLIGLFAGPAPKAPPKGAPGAGGGNIPGKSTGSASPFPVEPVVKVKKGGLSIPSMFTVATPSTTTPLPLVDMGLANTDITTLRSGSGTRKIIHDFGQASPELSATIFAYTRNAVSKDYTAVAKNTDGTFNPDATAVLKQLIARLDILTNYADGYSYSMSMNSVSESWVKELMLYGSCSGELILDKQALPTRVQPVSVFDLKFYPDPNKGVLRPMQYLGGQYIDLDTPAFVYVALDQDMKHTYSDSPLESALQPTQQAHEFLNDMRRVMQRAIHPRVDVQVIEDTLVKYMPDAARHDDEKRMQYVNQVVAQVQNMVNGLNPEDALVHLDSIVVEMLNNGSSNLSDEYKVIQDLINAKQATGAKVLPAILGHGTASSNIASTETMLFMKNVAGIQMKLNEMWSRLLTLAVRLMGYDIYVEYRYAAIDLRPAAELASFRAVDQSRVLELLSLGFITDEEASIQLTGNLPPAGFKPLSGTMFKSSGAAGQNSLVDGSSNNGSTLNQNLNSDAPKGVKSQNNKSDPQKAEVVNLRG